jgi:hypothetical protein
MRKLLYVTGSFLVYRAETRSNSIVSGMVSTEEIYLAYVKFGQLKEY